MKNNPQMKLANVNYRVITTIPATLFPTSRVIENLKFVFIPTVQLKLLRRKL